MAESSEVDFDEHLDILKLSLRVSDISIKRRALDALYLICNPRNCRRVVEDLVSYSEFSADHQIKEELVIRIVILAERFSGNLCWYIDLVVRLLNSSGAFVTEDIWFRVI
jgi:AP-2 complex subunit alpha